MNTPDLTEILKRLREVEDRQAIYQLVCGYGYAVDGLNQKAIASLYAEDGVYAVPDSNTWRGRWEVASITEDPGHVERVGEGVAHVSTLPYVVLDGDRATATCHTLLVRNGQDGFFIARLTGSRLELSRKADGGWEIDHRENLLLNGDAAASSLLGRLMEGPGAKAG